MRTYSTSRAGLYTPVVNEDPYEELVGYDEYGNPIYEIYYSYWNGIEDNTYFDKKYAIGVGWSFGFPSVEHSPSGKYLHLGDGSSFTIYEGSGENMWPSGLVNYYLKDMVFSLSSNTLSLKDGITYFFNSQGDLVRIANQFGDQITFTYTTFEGRNVIQKITDAQGREVAFTYAADRVTVTAGDVVIWYNLQAVGEANKRKLASVQYKSIGGLVEAGDRTVSYDYTLSSASFDLCYSDPSTNKFLNLTTVTHISGATSRYQYESYKDYIDPANPTSGPYMYLFRVKKRCDTAQVAGQTRDYGIYDFSYGLLDGSRKYNQKSQGVATWDTSNPARVTEKYYFGIPGVTDGEHLLAEKHTEGTDGLKTIETYSYAPDTKTPYQHEVKRYSGDQYETTTTKFAYDPYRNLLYELATHNDGTDEKTIREGFYTYYTDRYHIPESQITTTDKAAGMDQVLKAANVVDSYGRITSETEALCDRSDGDTGTVSAPGLTLVFTRGGEFWTWMTPRKVSSFTVYIEVFSGGFYNHADYTVWARPYNSSQWTMLERRTHYQLFSTTRYDTLTFDLNSRFGLSEPTFYEIKIVGDRIGYSNSNVKIHWLNATGPSLNLTTVPGQSLASSFVYDSTYKANLTSKTVGTYTTSYLYDSSTYFTYPKRIYSPPVSNPGFGTSGEVVSLDYTYDYFGRTKSVTDALSHITRFDYDKLGRTVKQINTDATEKRVFFYDSLDKVIVVDEDNVAAIYLYDDLGRHVASYGDLDADHTNGNEKKLLEKGYDSLGRLTQETDAEGHVTRYTYDSIGRITRIQYADGSTQIIAYDDKNRTKIVTDANGARTKYVMDPLGNVTETWILAQ